MSSKPDEHSSWEPVSSTVPRRPYASTQLSPNLPESLPIVGLGCSSFSTFFWREDDDAVHPRLTNPPKPDHPVVQKWVGTILHAVLDCGINLLDTAPWYGHGMSEIVIGYAMEQILLERDGDKNVSKLRREDIIINTKVGRYEPNSLEMFDFSARRVRKSVLQSLDRMKCGYIDVLQLHDPEYSPSMELLVEETIPALAKLRDEDKLVKAIGMTGYPLSVQRELIQRSFDQHGIVFDQSLVYCHYNLHDQTLFTALPSFADFCRSMGTGIITAAPLSMGLLTHSGPPEWHPASKELKAACRQAADLCTREGIDISNLAMLFVLGNQQIPCTILGMKDEEELDRAVAVAARFANRRGLKEVLTEQEQHVLDRVLDATTGPFAGVRASGMFQWDGSVEAEKFWKSVPGGKTEAEEAMRTKSL